MNNPNIYAVVVPSPIKFVTGDSVTLRMAIDYSVKEKEAKKIKKELKGTGAEIISVNRHHWTITVRENADFIPVPTAISAKTAEELDEAVKQLQRVLGFNFFVKAEQIKETVSFKANIDKQADKSLLKTINVMTPKGA